MFDSFVKTYGDRGYLHPTMVRHQGSVIAFAMDEERRIVYTVLDVTVTAVDDADRWLASPQELEFTTELAQVGLAVADQVELPLVRKGNPAPVPAGTPVSASEIDPVLSTTARFTADAPFQVLSDDVHLYVFRLSITPEGDPDRIVYERQPDGTPVLDAAGNPVPLVSGTLLVDRYVLVGTELQPTREVRFQRSRSRTRPQSSKDSLGATDLDKRPFVEPTQALSFISGVRGGGFAVVLVPTQVADVSRWQIFVADPASPLIDAYGIDRSADGLFDLRGVPAADRVAPGGFAGAALSFAADGDRLETRGPTLGASFTVEMWLKVAADAPAGEMALFGADPSDGGARGAGPSAWIDQGTRLRIGFGDGSAWHDSTTGDLLTPGSWNHVAISFDGEFLRVYGGGILRHRDGALKGVQPPATPFSRVGASSASFRGVVDEVRLWNVVRGASDISESMSCRLTGLEPGLDAYWRLDDGYGDTAWDGGSASPRVNAAIVGATWVTSDAPIADTTSFTRAGFRIYPRIVTSGLSALLYFQQEQAPSGYDGTAKPLKQAARVMLVMATDDGQAKGKIVALDFGVSRDGRLAQSPTELSLPPLDESDMPAGSPDQLLARAGELQSQIASLELQVGAAQGAANQLALAEQIVETPSSFFALDLSELPPLLRVNLHSYAIAQPGLRPLVLQQIVDGEQPLRQAASGLAALQSQLAGLVADLSALETALGGGVQLRMPLVHIDPNGLTLAGAVLAFARTPVTPLLFDSALGRVALYFQGQDGQFLAAHYDTLTDRARLTQPADTGVVSFFSRTANLTGTADDPTQALTLQVDAAEGSSVCTVTVTMMAPAGTVTETWRNVPRGPAALADVLNGAAATPVFVGLAEAAAGTVASLTVLDGTKVSLSAGAVLRAGGQTLRVQADTPAGEKSLVVTPVLATVNAGTPVVAVAYDYAADATTTQVPANLATGSNLVAVSADGASGQVQAGPATYIGQTAACRWYAAPPGGALSLDGVEGFAKPAPGADLTEFTSSGDLTLESWVKPAGSSGLGRIVACQAPGARGFTLGLRPQSGALQFDGLLDAVIVPTSSALQFSGSITLEAWVHPQATDGTRDIVAHGYRLDPPGEVFLRIDGGAYEIGSWNGDEGGTGLATLPIPPGDVGTWVHLAGVWDGSTWSLYRNGVLAASTPASLGAVSVGAGWAIGASSSGQDRLFAGGIDEVRIWKVARSAEQIAAGRGQRMTGSEPGLVGYWRPELPGNFHYVDQAQADAHVQGAPKPLPGPFSSFTALVGVDDQLVESTDKLPADGWSHLAAVFRQGYGVQFAGDSAYLDCGASETLDLIGDLTIEAGVRLDDLNAPQAVVGRGAPGGEDPGMPYAFTVGTDGRLVFTFADADGQPHAVYSTGTIGAGTFHRLAVTRRRTTIVDPVTSTDPATLEPSKLVHTFQDIAFFIDGQPAGGQRYTGADAQSSGAPTRIGQASTGEAPAVAQAGLHGALSEVRIWSTARAQANIGAAITGNETGLVSWWRLAENAGSAATDSKSNNTATLHGPISWIKSPDPSGSQLVVYRDGTPMTLATPQAPLAPAEPQFTLGALGNAHARDFLRGELAEVRLWRIARTQQQIQDNLFSRLTGGLEDLLLYYRFDIRGGAVVGDFGLRGHDLAAAQGCATVVSTAPLGDDIPQVRDALIGVPTAFNDTLATTPSVAEYAELENDANGNLTGVFKRCYGLVRDGRWQLVTGYKVGDVRAEWVGQAQFDPQLIGFLEGAPPVPSENLTVEDSYDDTSAVTLTEAESTTYSYASSKDTGFDLSVETSFGVGPAEDVDVGFGVITKLLKEKTSIGVKATFENSLGWLDQAQNGVGNTVTRVSSLGLRGSKEDPAAPAHPAVGARYVPDNTGFALVQSETADVFALRLAHTGALISYQMRANPDIPKDWNILTFPIDPRYTKQGTLDGKVGLDPDADYPNALNYSPDQSYFKPIEAYALKNQIVQEEQRLRARYEQYNAGAAGRAPGDPSLPQPFKRNLANTYVWTAAGGQFAEEEQSLDTVSETTGGSYAFKGMAGITGGLQLQAGPVALDFELTALFGGHYNLNVTKSVGSQSSFGVQSTAAPEARISTPNSHGHPVQQPGKVDAYRYMTFYLEPAADHHDAFFGQVIDPNWLAQSLDPAATALRKAQQPGKRPPCWRVVHRVTYVSRVLTKVEAQPGQPPTFEQTLQQLDLNSNYELISLLGPFVRDKTARYPDFVAAVQAAVRTYLPQLQPHLDTVVSFLVLYYGVTDSAQLALPSDDLSHLAPTPPAVYAGATQSVTPGKPVALQGSALDETVDPAALTVAWSKLDGPGDVTFSAPNAPVTEATFSQPGVYLLRLNTDNGHLSAHADTTITVVPS